VGSAEPTERSEVHPTPSVQFFRRVGVGVDAS